MNNTAILIVLILLFCSCKNNKKHIDAVPQENVPSEVSLPEHADINLDSAKAAFKNFRDHLYTGNIEQVKNHCIFPIRGRGNELWYLAYSGNEETLKLSEDNTPFPEDVFDRNYHRIFPKNFIKCLLKVKTDSLFSSGYYETEKIRDGNTTYFIAADFDKAENTLTIGFHGEEEIWEDDGEGNKIQMPGEFSTEYQLYFDQNNQLIFEGVSLAG